ncbi:hypothetical protein [Arenimonas sp. MALMAid1274]|uniref:hypothetical protein n=1 Tax=Arenimonas sp. MALMAid1274 TaxID=3411630 RepID=UPI003BA17DC7
MSANGPPPPPSSGPDDAGVRVVRKPSGPPGPWRGLAIAGVMLAVAGVVAYLGLREPTLLPQNPVATPAAAPSAPAVQARAPTRPHPALATDNLPSGDPNDLASYFRPGDEEPTGAEVIGALNDVGIHTGIGAFNPPGTSPPLEGLAVPEDFELPEGYVRHYQSTDEGVGIEPILMFSPGLQLRDGNGRLIALPDDLVVPPHLAPPGLPLRRVRIPSP